MKSIKPILFTLLLAGAAAAQTTPAKETIPSPPAAAKPVVVSPDYFAKQLSGMGIPTTAKDITVAPPKTPRPKPVATTVEASNNLPLNEAALEARKLASQWRITALVADDGSGRVLYRYGSGVPTAVCSPLQVCTIELQPGETINDSPMIADGLRWDSILTSYGSGRSITPMLILKPKRAGLDTSAVIATNRRVYIVRLVSSEYDPTLRVAFTYPDDEAAAERAAMSARRAEVEAAQEAERVAIKAREAVERQPAAPQIADLFFGYVVKGPSALMKPARVFDDGSKMYIQMPTSIDHTFTPVLMAGSGKALAQINYRVANRTFVVDQLYAHLQLLSGKNKDERVDIKRQAAKK